MLTRERKTDTAAAVGIGAAAVAIVCCAGLPAIAALLGGFTFGAILGLGLGAVILAAVAWTAAMFVARRRRRDRCREGRHR
jgi:hypothetical protein